MHIHVGIAFHYARYTAKKDMQNVEVLKSKMEK